MPLLTQNARLNAALAAEASDIASHLSAAAHKANAMVSIMLGLNDADLTDWLNSQPPQDTLDLFTAHGQLGEFINAAITVASDVLAASGLPPAYQAVDVRSVADKLSSQGRTLDFTGGIFTVSTPEPEPEPEPEP